MKFVVALLVLCSFAFYSMEQDLYCSTCNYAKQSKRCNSVRTTYVKCQPGQWCMNQTRLKEKGNFVRKCMAPRKREGAGCSEITLEANKHKWKRCWCNENYCNDDRIDSANIKQSLKCFHCERGRRLCRSDELKLVMTCEPGEFCYNVTTDKGVYRGCGLKWSNLKPNSCGKETFLPEGKMEKVSNGDFCFCDKDFCNMNMNTTGAFLK